MTTSPYRPEPGEQVFVSLYNNQPFLVTVTGYRMDDRLNTEVFDYQRGNGREDYAILKEATFYPDVPVDTRFLYLVMLEEHEFMEKSEEHILGYFFDPQPAFDYIDAIESGEVTPSTKATGEFVDYFVRVEKA